MKPNIVLFRRDLRLSDNPALYEAAKHKAPIVPVYVYSEEEAPGWGIGAATKFWLHHSLYALDKSMNHHLVIVRGDAEKVLKKILKETGAENIFWNRRYEPHLAKEDDHLQKSLEKDGIDVQIFQASLLWEPWDITKKDGTPYKVYTPYYRKGCLKAAPPRQPLKKPSNLTFKKVKSVSIDDLKLLPKKPRWDKKMEAYWTPGEDGAHKTLTKFLKKGFKNYKEGRNFPKQEVLSALSPHTHFGEVSPNQIWYASDRAGHEHHQEKELDTFHSELAWREFSYYLMHQFPQLPNKPWSEKFAKMKWSGSEKNLKAWQQGQTGYPIVDAGMRELWETGYMHNRIRMVVASFLIKHLQINWVKGEEWFWDCLVDGDLAVNAFNWQWVAGCGADAAPYFRVFNPVLQGEKFDKDGWYVRKWVPELKAMPDKYIHHPWDAPDDILRKAKVDLGCTYPRPLVEHNEARENALQAYKNLKK